VFKNIFSFSKSAATQPVEPQKKKLAKELLDMQKLPEDGWLKKVKVQSTTRLFRINSPIGVDSKTLAKTAAARIDAIEKEIALDLRGSSATQVGIHNKATEIALRNGIDRFVQSPGGIVQTTKIQFPKTLSAKAFDRLERAQNSDIAPTLMLGNTNLGEVIDVKESLTAPAVEEAAVLYATGQLDAAIAVLIEAFQNVATLGKSEYNAYRLLFDLLRYKGDSTRFDRYAIDFVQRFEKSPPTWQLAKQKISNYANATPTLDLGEMLDASIVSVLEQLQVYSQTYKVMRLNAGNITSISHIDGFGCELLMRVMNAFEGTEYQLDLVGISNLFERLRPYIQSRSTTVSGHLWILYLELIRLQNLKILFDDLALKFASLYEVSPPSWRAPTKLQQEGHSILLSPKTITMFERPDFIKLSGTINASNDNLISQIATGLHVSPTVVCDCSELVLIDFDSAGRLLTALTAWSADLKTVEFKNVSNPIATLFIVLGIQHLAVVERRKDI
jgi:ABC-type transporter Mla MlaB component